MKVIKTNKSFSGLLEAEFYHEIAKTTGTLLYTGPKIPPSEWHRVLSFFRWTYETTRSESQVRLYVNTSAGTWSAWAYPQEARTGMTAKELDTPAHKEQRTQFPDDKGWIYFGTVHHHCSASAFQSGTDKWNEEKQDGLHITVGNIDKARHDLHCRFCLDGEQFDPDMSHFWDSGIQGEVPVELLDKIARYQMGSRVEVEFPGQWRENLIEVKSVVPSYQGGLGYNSGDYRPGWMGGNHASVETFKPAWERARDAIREMESKCLENNILEEDLQMALSEVATDLTFALICDAIFHHKVEIDDILKEYEDETWQKRYPRQAIGEGGSGMTQAEIEAWGGYSE